MSDKAASSSILSIGTDFCISIFSFLATAWLGCLLLSALGLMSGNLLSSTALFMSSYVFMSFMGVVLSAWFWFVVIVLIFKCFRLMLSLVVPVCMLLACLVFFASL